MPEQDRTRIEELVRQSLRQRSEDVEPTPALWQEVDRRVARHRRRRSWALSLTGATALLAALVVVPGLLDAVQDPARIPEIAPLEQAPVTGERPEDGAADTTPSPEGPTEPDTPRSPPEPGNGEASRDDDPDGDGADPAGDGEDPATGVAGPDLGQGLVVANGPELLLVEPDGTTRTLYTFPSEGHSTIAGVSVRPGSTPEDLTVALLTQAEGMYDVRWLRAVDGGSDGAQLFEHPEAQLGTPIEDGNVPHPVWSPEGDLLAFVSTAPDGSDELTVIGWDEDAPTDDPNRAIASFGVDAETLRAEQWVWTDDAEGVARQGELLLSDPAGDGLYALPLERQGDGAVALPAQVELEPRTEDGLVDGREPGQVVERVGPGLAVVRDSGAVPLELPELGAVAVGDPIPE